MIKLSYQERVKEALTQYKLDNFGSIDDGFFHNKEYSHILPAERWQENLWIGKREAILDYVNSRGLKWHVGKAHLNSSQVLCFNLFFPFLNNLRPLEHYFKENLKDFSRFTTLQFEYSNSRLLSEVTPTSVDLALGWEDTSFNSNLFLCEFKYSEESFGSCNNYDKEKCIDSAIYDSTKCRPTSEGVEYWRYLKNGPLYVEEFKTDNKCPYGGSLYQLMRNQLLAHVLEKSGHYCKVVFMVIYPEQNIYLRNHIFKIRLSKGNIISWTELVREQDRFLPITIEDIFNPVIKQNDYKPWTDFIKKKYGKTLNLSK
jgi:hypothetical protein